MKISQSIIDQIKPLYEQLRNSYVVAHNLGVSQSFVLNTLKRQDFDTTRIKVLNKEDIVEVRKLYLEGCSSRFLAKKYDVSKHTILETIKDLEFRNNNRRYFRNSNSFKNIETEQEAYLLGLMFADGYNDEKHGQITLTLSSKDIELVKHLKDYIQTDQPIYTNLRPNGFEYSSFVLNDKGVSRNIAKHGCVQAKTFILKYPKIREDLYNHFIRGYFDGDGSVYNGTVSLVGSEEFLLSLNEQFYKDIKINYSTIRTRHPERNHNIRETRYIGKNKCVEIYKYLYKDATIYLTRKKERFEKIFSKHI